APSITTPPVPEIIVEINGTFSIICEAVGTPTPLIVWRLNWGNIPTGPRVTVTNYQGRGVLTIRNARLEDAGAYTCEALNNKGSIFAVPDALIIVRTTQGVCKEPTFNRDALTKSECVKCFCFGHTRVCDSSDLQYSQISLGNQVAVVRRDTMEPVEQSLIRYIPVSRQFEITDYNRVLRSGSWYWSLPYQYLSKRINSYGGELTYQVYYDIDGFEMPTNDPDIIISGNGLTLYHTANTNFQARTPTTVSVKLVENQWFRTPGGRRGSASISGYATREDMMITLEDVTSLLIRATYDNQQNLVRLGNVLLTTAVPQDTGRDRAFLVEECSCPTGYSGYSCEDCAPGFYRVGSGEYGRECISCNCNGHSNECDPLTGVCQNCRDNTEGPNCDQCRPGYVGDPRNGQRDACEPCPCPLTSPQNQFSESCVRESDRQITCTACQAGYEGRNCERCAVGYEGNPNIPGGRCIRRDVDDRCDERGSNSLLIDPTTRQCDCKTNVQGRLCNQCEPDTFYLSESFPDGCISCFCMGVTQTCQSSTYNRAQVTLSFQFSADGMTMSDIEREQSISQGFVTDFGTRELLFLDFQDPAIRYWSLPDKFLGNKLTSYGGNLRLTLRYKAGNDNSPLPLNEPLVQFGGNGHTFLYTSTEQWPENRAVPFTIPFIESQWSTPDGQRVMRQFFLMALADIEYILVRATFTQETEEAGINGVSMDIAESRETGQDRAYAVEQCVCPRGYEGLSCEKCITGYTRTGGGLYLGLCEPCQCNGHSNECDPETGVCRNCRHNTMGPQCDKCAQGYYGDATVGSSGDCQRCPCPLTESPNQFSPECILDTDGQVTCTACPPGHSGRRCERCEPGYTGNPLQPGDSCKLLNATCDCDVRGTLPNTLCDPNTQQCQCKINAQGRRCSSCKDGYFNLDRENDAGCLKCFCMDITDQCTSSRYYRSSVVPILNSDGTHNFQLVNRRLSRIISDGFRIDVTRNEITFDNFLGIQTTRESLYFNLPPKFRGDKVSSYGGYLRFSLAFTRDMSDEEEDYRDVDIELISRQGREEVRLYHFLRPAPRTGSYSNYEILLTETSFQDATRNSGRLTRERMMTVLADLDAVLIRVTYHKKMTSVTLRDLSMDMAVPSPTGQDRAPEVERCTCPEGYSGLSCQQCAPGFSRVSDPSTALGRCTRCNCNGHANSCDPLTGVCQDCQDNTEGDRCERCAAGYYGDATAGTPNDCRVCRCPLDIPSNQFSRTCFLDSDSQVTCDRCPVGYSGRQCERCSPGYVGNPSEPGGRCVRDDGGNIPNVIVNPVTRRETLGSTAIMQCRPEGRGPFTVVWSRLDGSAMPPRATQGPGPNYLLTIPNLEYTDEARYVCTVTNAFGSNRAYVQLYVEPPDRPLKIRIEQPTEFVGRPGQTARLICVVVQYSGEPDYVLGWNRAGGLPDKAIEQNGVLVIPNLEESDLGTYTCTGVDTTGTDSAQATISFADILESPKVRIEPRYLQKTQGEAAELRCIATGSPAPTVVWFKGSNMGPLPSYVFTDNTGLFRIDSVRRDDEDIYFCKATNSEGEASERTIIYVSIPRQEYTVIVRNTNLTATIGSNEQLECYVEGNPQDVTLVWSKERGSLPPGSTQEDGFLTLLNIQPSYAGTYVCTGTTSFGVIGGARASVNVVGRAYTAPQADIYPQRQTVGIGQTASLTCRVSGEPTPTVVWTKSGGPLTNNHQVVGNILRISQASMADRDLYTCTASNIAGTVKATAFVEVEQREGPSVRIYPRDNIIGTQGGTAEFRCLIVGGNPTPTVTWTRSGGQAFTSRTSVMQDTIKFQDLTADEQGEYTCVARNAVGVITATASLRIEGPPVISITPSTGDKITAIKGERINLECTAVGEPTPTVSWRSGQRRRSDVLPEASEPGPGSAQLVFDSVKETDAGSYICTAFNSKGRTEKIIDLIVEEQSDILGAIIEGPPRPSYIPGQSVELTCRADNLLNPRIQWRRPGGVPLPPGHSVRSGVLFIPNIEPQHGGEYICTVTSDSPIPGYPRIENRASVYIIVTVIQRPRISPTSVTAPAGQTIRLTCTVEGTSSVNIEWQKVPQPLPPNSRQVDGVLEIRNVSPADSGRYRCIVRTPNGATQQEYADVYVQTPPSVNIQVSNDIVNAGATVEFRCDVSGDPAPKVTWTRLQGELPPQHSTEKGVLVIYNVQAQDTGVYICTASNSIGESRQSVNLLVQ
ncbi:basement membrane-specific heparan sulfate proteoglycan core protein, partial [Plakobranchus ocellatus]